MANDGGKRPEADCGRRVRLKRREWFALVLFLLADVGAFLSVPKPVRAENEWALSPGCGFVLAAEYYFGAKLKAP